MAGNNIFPYEFQAFPTTAGLTKKMATRMVGSRLADEEEIIDCAREDVKTVVLLQLHDERTQIVLTQSDDTPPAVILVTSSPVESPSDGSTCPDHQAENVELKKRIAQLAAQRDQILDHSIQSDRTSRRLRRQNNHRRAKPPAIAQYSANCRTLAVRILASARPSPGRPSTTAREPVDQSKWYLQAGCQATDCYCGQTTTSRELLETVFSGTSYVAASEYAVNTRTSKVTDNCSSKLFGRYRRLVATISPGTIPLLADLLVGCLSRCARLTAARPPPLHQTAPFISACETFPPPRLCPGYRSQHRRCLRRYQGQSRTTASQRLSGVVVKR
ncbi:hypothetical protein J6590_056866 [Homalodisca vitripennis]|nr:hypothetical protein J6590_056866 [Homalodisca vitripennis]